LSDDQPLETFDEVKPERRFPSDALPPILPEDDPPPNKLPSPMPPPVRSATTAAIMPISLPPPARVTPPPDDCDVPGLPEYPP
jgi:hypothetical protein